MPQEYTPSGSPIAYTVPAYADVVDGPTAFKSFADDVYSGLAAKIASTIVDAKGDIIVATAADTVSRLAVGTNGQALVADSTAGTGVKWGSAGGLVYITSSAFSAAATASVNNCFSSTYDNYRIVLYVTGTSGNNLSFRYRASSTDNSAASYAWQVANIAGAGLNGSVTTGATSHRVCYLGTNYSAITFDVFRPGLAANTLHMSQGYADNGGASQYLVAGVHNVASAFDGFTLIPDASTITGTVRVYGYINS